MKTSSPWNLKSIVGKIMMGLVLAAMIGSVDMVPALGEDRRMEKHEERHDTGRSEHRGRGYYDRDRNEHGRRDYRPYGYAPPPVVYAPYAEPGISIFLPIR